MKTKAQNKITITVHETNKIILRIAGKDTMSIDWGDETKVKTYQLRDEPPSTYTHIYTGTSAHAITITGGDITHLICQKQDVTNLDVTRNTGLKELYCSNNKITELDLSKNTALTYLSCYNNQLTNLDLRNNRLLRILGCPGNNLTNLDISGDAKLTHLFCTGNQLKSLDISKNTKLTVCDCSYNQLTSMDVSQNADLDYLNCSKNRLSSLNTGNNTDLRVLFCDKNCLTGFDASRNTSLVWLIINENQISTDEINALFRTLPFGEENIICIEKNPGADGCDKSIVESKGWEIIDYNIYLPESKNKVIRMVIDEYCF